MLPRMSCKSSVRMRGSLLLAPRSLGRDLASFNSREASGIVSRRIADPHRCLAWFRETCLRVTIDAQEASPLTIGAAGARFSAVGEAHLTDGVAESAAALISSAGHAHLAFR